MIIFLISHQTYDVTPHLNRLDETVQMRGHNICFKQIYQNLSLIITKWSLLSKALCGYGLSESCLFAVIIYGY